MQESLEEAVARELKEETGLDGVPLEQLYTWGDVMRDPRGRVISVSYLALLKGVAPQVRGNDDAEEARWFGVDFYSKKEGRTVTDTGYVLKSDYRLRLLGATDEVSAIIQVTRNVSGQAVKITRDIVESRGIAFDHAKIIAYALERLQENLRPGGN